MIEWMLVYVMIDTFGNTKPNAYTGIKTHQECVNRKYELDKAKHYMYNERTVRIDSWCQKVSGPVIHNGHRRKLTDD
jgi:hypothetical protein